MEQEQEQIKEPEDIVEEPEVEPGKPEQAKPKLADALGMLGVSMEDAVKELSPLLEMLVVQTLEKMKLGEVINKRLAEVEEKLGEKIRPIAELASASGNAEQPGAQPGAKRDALMEAILPILAQKFLGSDSGGGSLEALTKTLQLAQQVTEVTMKPFMDGQHAARQEMNETLRMLGMVGATPAQKQGYLSGAEGSTK